MLPQIVNLAEYRGDTWSETFRLVEDGSAVDLSGAELAASARDMHGAVLELVVAATENVGELTLGPPADEEQQLAPGPWQYDVRVTIGTAVTTWVRGRLDIVSDVTP